MTAHTPFPRGGLAAIAAARVWAARQSGALQSIATDLHRIDDGPVRFLVRVLASLKQKEREVRAQSKAADDGEGAVRANPFLPHDPRLFVADLTPTHFCLLNKFNVTDSHLLLVTRAFEDQERLLTPADLEAMALVLSEIDGLGFFNGGTAAGASQPHKHLQLVPLPLAPGAGAEDPALPIEPLLAPALANAEPGVPATVAGFSFRHALLRLGGDPGREELDEAYRRLLAATGLAAPDAVARAETRPALPYNLLLTRRWMLMVPRSRERIDGISINALGYAGSLFVRDSAEMTTVVCTGPLRLITQAAVVGGRSGS